MRSIALAIVFLTACAMPDSVALGAPCTDSRECKDPSDTCMVFGAKKLCTMTCSADDKCPEGYACPVLDTAVQKDGEQSAGGRQGYCIPKGDVPARAVTAY